MYTKKELKENEIIEEAIHENNKKYKKTKKKRLFFKIIDFIFYFMACATFILSLMFFIAVIENLRF